VSTTRERDVFAEERPRLLGLAYRLMAERADAEDVVQEAWLRWSTADQAAIDNPQGWLTTVTSRLALDRLRAIRRRREVYVGPWLPDPVSTQRTPMETAELAESLTLGFLVLLDRLGPVERAVFLLADVFVEPFAVISEAVGKSEAACRQIAMRARRKVRSAAADEDGVRAPASAELLSELMVAVLSGDEEQAMHLLATDVVLLSDGGPSRRAARRPVVGPDRVLRLLAGGWRLFGFHSRPSPTQWPPSRLAIINASPTIVVDAPTGAVIISGEMRDGLVTHIWVRLNPDKLSGLELPLEML
jgi:RNA polymerase sigma-70 factor (ECF subfamily)